jgi:transposase
MDFHLDTLLNLPNITVFTATQVEGFTLLTLEFLNEGIYCPHCQSYTDTIHQTRPILVRDLPICGQPVHLHLPRRQFDCQACKKSPTEPLSFVDKRRNYTRRYEEYIYERVKELTVEQVSRNEQLSPAKVENIFQRIASQKKKTGANLND